MANAAGVFFSLFFALIGIPGPGSSSVQAQQATFSAKFRTSPSLAVIDPGEWRLLARGVEFRTVTLERAQPYHVMAVKLARLDSRWMVPRILASSRFNVSALDVRSLARMSGASAAINANYFNEKWEPLGFLKIAGGELNSRLSRSTLFTGIFGIKNHSPFILHREEFSSQQVDEGLQAGPLLVHKGRVLTVKRGAGNVSRRSLVGIDSQRKLILGVTEGSVAGLSWTEVQELFSAEQWGIRVLDLLNLDGGGSAQLYLKGLQHEEHVPGSSLVPVALGFFPSPP